MSVDVTTGAHPIKVPSQIQGCSRPHGQPVSCKVRRARETCSEILQELASIQDELSSQPGTSPTRRYEYWLGVMQGLTGYLLLTLEEQDAARR